MDYLDFSLLLSAFQSIYYFLNTILLEDGKERARKNEWCYAATVKGLSEVENLK